MAAFFFMCHDFFMQCKRVLSVGKSFTWYGVARQYLKNYNYCVNCVNTADGAKNFCLSQFA